MLCGKLHCEKSFNLILFAYKIGFRIMGFRGSGFRVPFSGSCFPVSAFGFKAD